MVSSILLRDKPFNQTTLSENNQVYTSGFPKWYDTIVHIGMERVGLQGYHVFINSIPQNFINDTDYKATLYYNDGNFYIFTVHMDRSEAIDVLGHEIMHMVQYDSQKLVWKENVKIVEWHGGEYSINSIEYELRPWEREAFAKGSKFSHKLKEILW
jgi:hypothetical protein